MIYSHSMMSGYLCLMGSYMFHIPMLIAMLIFIRIPPEADMQATFPENARTAVTWYWFALIMHVFLTAMHIIG